MKDKILRYKKLILGLVLHLLFLGWLLFLYSGSPPDIDVEVYKGAPIGVNEFSYDIAQEMKEDGLNIVRTTMFWMVDNDGNLHELPWVKAYIISQFQNAHKRGLKIFLSLRPQYGGFTSPRHIPESVRSTFFLQFNQRVLEWASICENTA